jgi:hypothetical protein
MTQQWIRQCLLTVSDESTGTTWDVSELRIRFQVTTRVTIIEPDTASIRIYNPSPDTINKLLNMPIVPVGNPVVGQPDTQSQPAFTATGLSRGNAPISNKPPARVRLQAGYQGNFGVVFQGQLVQVISGRETPTETCVDIFAADGDAAHKWGMINATLNAGYTAQDVVDRCMQGLPSLGVKSGGKFPTDTSVTQNAAPRGKTLFGQVRDTLSDLSKTYRCNWWFEDDQLKFLPLSAYAPGDTVVIDSTSGMIGRPVQTNYGVSVVTLLNPGIGRGTQVKIDNKSVQRQQFQAGLGTPQKLFGNVVLAESLDADGLYKVFKLVHSGDTRGNEWYTTSECISIDPTDLAHAMVPDASLLTM